MRSRGQKLNFHNMKAKHKRYQARGRTQEEDQYFCDEHGNIEKPYFVENEAYCPKCLVRGLKNLRKIAETK